MLQTFIDISTKVKVYLQLWQELIKAHVTPPAS